MMTLIPDVLFSAGLDVNGCPLAATGLGVSQQHRSGYQRGRGRGHRGRQRAGLFGEGALTSYALVSRVRDERLDRRERSDRHALLFPAASSVSGSDDAAVSVSGRDDAAVSVSGHRRRHEAAVNVKNCFSPCH